MRLGSRALDLINIAHDLPLGTLVSPTRFLAGYNCRGVWRVTEHRNFGGSSYVMAERAYAPADLGDADLTRDFWPDHLWIHDEAPEDDPELVYWAMRFPVGATVTTGAPVDRAGHFTVADAETHCEDNGHLQDGQASPYEGVFAYNGLYYLAYTDGRPTIHDTFIGDGGHLVVVNCNRRNTA